SRLVAQYDAYAPFEDAHVNGRLTLGENIGDLSGLTMAHRAYVLSLDGEEPAAIDGFTGDQRFFMGWAQVWRIKHRDAFLRQLLQVDSHAPGQYRAVGPLSHIPAFYTAFAVQEGDALYLAPEDRIKLWWRRGEVGGGGGPGRIRHRPSAPPPLPLMGGLTLSA